MITRYFNIILKYVFIYPRIILYGIIILVYLKYNINTLYCLGEENIYELEGEPSYNLSSNPRQYFPYNPGVVMTNEGYRVELDSKEISLPPLERPHRIENPANYPPEY
jgi:hypothetical protein